MAATLQDVVSLGQSCISGLFDVSFTRAPNVTKKKNTT